MIQYIPIVTSIFAVYFVLQLWKHYRTKPGALHLLWWLIGVITYGAGTVTESINTIFGWTELNFRFWYVLGALLGGFPLATGTVYLLINKRLANYMTYFFLLLITVAAVLVFLSPVLPPADGRLTGKVLSWEWVRYFSPFVNSYSFIFLFGGAIYSAIKYLRMKDKEKRFLGNVLIGIGALLPGIGGSFTRFGYVEVLYVTELLGLLMIFWGYIMIRDDKWLEVNTSRLPDFQSRI